MRLHKIDEDKLPPRFTVVLSTNVSQNIRTIYEYNQNNLEALSQWYEFMSDMWLYISNRAIALDYANRYSHLSDGTIHMNELGYDIVFYVGYNSAKDKSYVYVSKVKLNPQSFGLEVPPGLVESKHNHSVIRLTEAQFKRMLTECITKIINEIA